MNSLTKESPRLETPQAIITKIKPHQETLIFHAVQLENGNLENNSLKIDTIAGVIADNVGSGKSLTALSIVANKLNLEPIERCFSSIQGMINVYTKHFGELEKLNTNIIVVPHSIISQWISYIENDTKLSHIVINNKKTFLKIEDPVILNDYNITLVSSTKYKDFHKLLLNKYYVSRLFFDEADSINIPACPKVDSVFYWFITSSYRTLLSPYGTVQYQNPDTNEVSIYYNWHSGFTRRIVTEGLKNTGFIKDLFKDAWKEHFSSIFLKNSSNYVKESFSLPEPIIRILNCKNPITLSILNGILPKDVMAKLNAGDIKGAIETINCTKVDESNVIKVFTNDLEVKYNNLELTLNAKKQMTYASKKAKEEALFKIEIKMKSIRDKIQSVTDRINDNNMCTICYDSIKNNTISKCCNQSFCFECITMWLSQKPACPMCRAPLSVNDLVVVSDTIEPKEQEEKNDKIDNFIKILDKINANSKILVFSEFDASFDSVKEELSNRNIKYSKVIGTATSVNKIITNYKKDNTEDDSVQVLLLNSRYFGSGLNLENTSDVIIFHNMNTEMNKQIIGRAQRPGRTETLNIWRLCYDNELNQNFSY